MNDQELYQQKKQAQLDEWKAELEKFKAKAAGANADAQLRLKEQLNKLEGKIAEGKLKLSNIADANEDEWEAIKDGVESSWSSMKSAFRKAADELKK